MIRTKIISNRNKSSAGKLMLVHKGRESSLLFPTMPDKVSILLSNLIHSQEIAEFQNIYHLATVQETYLPILPKGYFWYKNGKNWTIRKWNNVPEVVLDLDIYLTNGVFAGYNLNVNKNLVATLADTNVIPQIKGKRKSAYGGFFVDDFGNLLQSNFNNIRGHGIAYRDSIKGFDKNLQTINSDHNPRNFSAEKSSRRVGKYKRSKIDLGEGLRNHQLEAYTRRKKGKYIEFNEFPLRPEQIKCGLFVPSIKHMIRITHLGISYASFPQNEEYKCKRGVKTSDLWQQKERSLAVKPSPLVLNMKKVDFEKLSLGMKFGFYLTSNQVFSSVTKSRHDIGTRIYIDNNEARVVVGVEPAAHGFRHYYYRFKRVIHLPVAYYPSMTELYRSMSEEIGDIYSDYYYRFSNVNSALDKLDSKIRSLSKYLHLQRETLLRILNGCKGYDKTDFSPKGTRKKDIKELIDRVKENLKKTKRFQTEAIIRLKKHLNFRAEIFNKAKEFSDFKILKTQNNTENEDIKANADRTLGELCNLIQTIDKQELKEISELIKAAAYYISSIESILSPPEMRI